MSCGVSFKNSTSASIKNSRSNLATQHYSCLGRHLSSSDAHRATSCRSDGRFLAVIRVPAQPPTRRRRTGMNLTHSSGEALDVRSACSTDGLNVRPNNGPWMADGGQQCHQDGSHRARTVTAFGRRDYAGRAWSDSGGTVPPACLASRETIQIKRATKRH